MTSSTPSEAPAVPHASRACIERTVHAFGAGLWDVPRHALFDLPREAVARVTAGETIALYVSSFDETSVASKLLCPCDYEDEGDTDVIPSCLKDRSIFVGNIIWRILKECKKKYLLVGLIDYEGHEKTSRLIDSRMAPQVTEDMETGDFLDRLYVYDARD